MNLALVNGGLSFELMSGGVILACFVETRTGVDQMTGFLLRQVAQAVYIREMMTDVFT